LAATPTASPPPDRAAFPCRLCGGRDLRLYYTLGNQAQFRYFRCAGCGLVNYDLDGGIDQGQYTKIFVDPRDDTNPRNHDNDAAFRFLQQKVRGPGRLMDIGCGNGRILWVARQAGWQVKGLELSEEMARYAAGIVGCEVVANDFLSEEPPRRTGRPSTSSACATCSSTCPGPCSPWRRSPPC